MSLSFNSFVHRIWNKSYLRHKILTWHAVLVKPRTRCCGLVGGQVTRASGGSREGTETDAGSPGFTWQPTGWVWSALQVALARPISGGLRSACAKTMLWLREWQNPPVDFLLLSSANAFCNRVTTFHGSFVVSENSRGWKCWNTSTRGSKWVVNKVYVSNTYLSLMTCPPTKSDIVLVTISFRFLNSALQSTVKIWFGNNFERKYVYLHSYASRFECMLSHKRRTHYVAYSVK